MGSFNQFPSSMEDTERFLPKPPVVIIMQGDEAGVEKGAPSFVDFIPGGKKERREEKNQFSPDTPRESTLTIVIRTSTSAWQV